MSVETRHPLKWFKKALRFPSEDASNAIHTQPPRPLKVVEMVSGPEAFRLALMRRVTLPSVWIPSILVVIGLVGGGIYWSAQKSSASDRPKSVTDLKTSISSSPDRASSSSPDRASRDINQLSSQLNTDSSSLNTSSSEINAPVTPKPENRSSSEINAPVTLKPENRSLSEINASVTLEPENPSSVENFPSGQFAYGGSTAWALIRRDIDPILQAAVPEFRLRYSASEGGNSGSSEGIHLLLDNQLAFAQSTRPLHPKEYQKALKQGFYLSEIPVGFEAIAIAVHPDLAVAGLTLAQLRDIYIGELTNWNQLGGPDLEIIPYSLSAEETGTAEFFENSVMEGLPFGENVIVMPTTTQTLRQVAQHPGGIYYASAPEIIGQCTVKPLPIGRQTQQMVSPYTEPLVPANQCPARRNQLNSETMQVGHYPLIQPLLVVVKHDGQADEQAGKAYAHWLLTDQGQERLRKAGFIHIR